MIRRRRENGGGVGEWSEGGERMEEEWMNDQKEEREWRRTRMSGQKEEREWRRSG